MDTMPTLCIVALDIIEFSKKPSNLKREIKNQFDDLIKLATKDIPENNRHIAQTPEGAVIACTGPSEEAIEDALFLSLTIRDEVLKNNVNSLKTWYVQIGIDLASETSSKVSGKATGAVGEEGLDKAGMIMSFANPNQILVSSTYYQQASQLTKEIAGMFEQYDLHTHDENIYAVRPFGETAAAEEVEKGSPQANPSATAEKSFSLSGVNWLYPGFGLLMLVAFFMLSNTLLTPVEPAKNVPVETLPIGTSPADIVTVDTQEDGLEESADVAEQAEEKVSTKKPKVANRKKAKKKPKARPLPSEDTLAVNDADNAVLAVNPPVADVQTNTASGDQPELQAPENVQKSLEHRCTQAEIAMNQCSQYPAN